MIIRKTEEMYEGKTVYLIGDTGDKLKKHYQSSEGEFILVPVSREELSKLCKVSYKNKEGKEYTRQEGETEILASLPTGETIGRAIQLSGKDFKIRTPMVVVFNKTYYPDIKIPQRSSKCCCSICNSPFNNHY